MSYEIATICRDVPLEINIEDTKYLGSTSKLKDMYWELVLKYLIFINLKD